MAQKKAKSKSQFKKVFGKITQRRPRTAGDVLREDYLEPLGLTQARLAKHIHVEPKTVNRLVMNHTSITPTLAVRIASALNVSPEVFLGAQTAVSIWDMSRVKRNLPKPLVLN